MRRAKSWSCRWVQARHMQPGMLVNFGEDFQEVEAVMISRTGVRLEFQDRDMFGSSQRLAMDLPHEFSVPVPEGIRYHDETPPPVPPCEHCAARGLVEPCGPCTASRERQS